MARRNASQPSRPAVRGGAKSERGTKTPAELEAERLARGRGATRGADDDKSEKDGDDDEERDDEGMDDDERDGAGSDDKDGEGDGADDERDGSGDDDADGDEDGKGDDDKDGERAAPGRRKALTEAEVRKAAETAVRADRRRAAQIREIGAQFGLPKLAERHAGLETSVRGFKDLVLERLAKRQAKRGDTTFGANSDEDVSRDSGRRAPGHEQREMTDGEAHWRRVAGKPPKAA